MIRAWSPSKLEKYEQCPLKCKLETEDKLCPLCFKGRTRGGFGKPVVCDACGGTVPESPALARGTALHAKLEALVQSPADPLVIEKDLMPVGKWITEFSLAHKEKRVMLEVEVALNDKWERVEWFSKDAWLRCKIDLLHLRSARDWDVVDWKTGKLYDDGKYNDQLLLYCVAVLSGFETPDTVAASLIFVDAGRAVGGEIVKRKGLRTAQKAWTKRVKKMLVDEQFVPNPGNYCTWCSYSRAKGGPCKF